MSTTSTTTFSLINPSTWFSSSSSAPTADPAKIKAAEDKLNAVKVECDTKIQEATTELNKEKSLPLPTQPLVGGRRRKSGRKSTNKRRRPAKKSLFNITKKWNPFAK